MSFFQQQNNEFAGRHIGPRSEDTQKMLETIGVSSLEELIDKTVPDAIRMKSPLALSLIHIWQNKTNRSYSSIACAKWPTITNKAMFLWAIAD